MCDYGAGNLNLYYYLDKKFRNLDYFFKDQKLVEEKVRIIANNNKLKNFSSVIQKISLTLISCILVAPCNILKIIRKNLLNFLVNQNTYLFHKLLFFKMIN